MSSIPFRKILCPVDFSANSRTALRHAAVIAARSGGRLTVLYVNDPLLSAAAAASAYDVKKLARDTDRELRRFVSRSLGRGRGVAYKTANGQPAQEVERVAAQLGADLVVVGSRGLTGASKWFFGSTTERLLRGTQVPVLVVPRGRRPAGSGWQSALAQWPGGRVLVPIDLEDHHAIDARRAVATAKALGSEAILLYAVPQPQVPEWLRLNPRRRDAGRVQEAQRRLEELAQTLGADGCHVTFGDAADEIIAFVAANDIQLVVLPLAFSRGLLGPRQGSITYQIVSSDIVPVLGLPSSRSRRRFGK